MPHLSNTTLFLLGLLVVLLALAPLLWRLYGQRFGMFAGKAYQKRMLDQLKKKYPLVAARLDGFDLGPGSQDGFQNAMKRLPPQKAQEFQIEFERLRTNFMARHPELEAVLGAGQDPKAQVKAMNTVMNFPEEQRKTIEKDLLWAWDALRSRFPNLMGPLESSLKKKVD
jgi:hypothetical protein